MVISFWQIWWICVIVCFSTAGPRKFDQEDRVCRMKRYADTISFNTNKYDWTSFRILKNISHRFVIGWCWTYQKSAFVPRILSMILFLYFFQNSESWLNTRLCFLPLHSFQFSIKMSVKTYGWINWKHAAYLKHIIAVKIVMRIFESEAFKFVDLDRILHLLALWVSHWA
jgi:hypothetical protein